MRALTALTLLLACTCAQAGSWSDLWWTREQQGQRLLQQHRPQEAARLFSDPRRRAYAEGEAGHPAQTAQLLKPFLDADSLYNRGNALARSGQLAEALAAYDAALKRAPQDPDIRHNRELVARALKHKPPQEDAAGGQDKRPDPGKDHNKEQQAGQAGRKQGDRRDGQPSADPKGHSSAQGKEDRQGGQSQGSPASDAGQNADPARQAQTSSPGSQAGTPHAGPDGSRQSGSGQSADREALGAGAAGGAQYLRDGQHDEVHNSKSAGTHVPAEGPPPSSGRAPHARPPPSEASLALDQWLQRIPEDAGELLRRKLRIEYNMRHPEQAADP
jgi:Ca-activated chloride channel family protein